MKRLYLLALLIGFMAACSGSDATQQKCDAALDCDQAFTCVEGKCEQVECLDFEDCPGDDETCLLGADPDQPEKKFCTPVQCNSQKPCEPGYECNEYYQCVALAGPDVVDGDVVDGDVPGTTDVTPDQAAPAGGNLCEPCATDADCGGLKCYALSPDKFCFGTCTTNNDCPTGWMCYELTTDGTVCIPMAFNCEPTCLTEGCPDGQVCDQESGECQTPQGECGECTHDWDCQDGYRCYTDQGYCAPACGDGTCPENSVCQEVNAIKVKLCLSSTAVCCYGDSCENPCQAPTPYPFEGECVECTEDGHCAEGKYCDLVSHSCMDAACSPPTPFQKEDGTCVECLNTSHCASKGAGYVCQNNVCVTDDKPEECSYCVDPYPACAEINGVWSCVQCTDDSYCPGSTCDLSLYACENGGTGPGCGSCTSDAECISSTGKDLKCDTASGCCYDAAGFCDDVEAMCDSTAGSECLGLMELLMGGMGGIPGMPEGMAGGVCTCSEPMGMEGFMCLLMPPCPSGGCLGNAVCIDPSAIPLLGDIAGMLSGAEGICLDPASLMDLVGGGLF